MYRRIRVTSGARCVESTSPLKLTSKMADGMWYVRLQSAFKKLGGEGERGTSGSKNILEVRDGRLSIWHQDQSSVYALNLFDLQHGFSNSSISNEEDEYLFQCYMPSCPPVYDVVNLSSNSIGDRLALIGQNGVNVMEIPKRQKVNQDPSDKRKRVLCSSVEISEHFFVCNPTCKVLQVKWHPVSDTSTHLVILFSNNYLRVFDCRTPAVPEQVFQLGTIPTFRLSPSATSSFKSALGETAVDFDFGRPIPATHLFQRKVLERMMDPDDFLLPVYILRGNGDVYSTWMANPRYKPVKGEIRGPLTMHPPAEDNYGADACSILCVPSSPPVLVIATASGMLYHCIVLDVSEDDSDESEDRSKSLECLAPRSITKKLLFSAPDVCLYVYESVELELSPTSDSNETLEEPLNESGDAYAVFSIRLHKDPTTIRRYHCSHSSGVHTVALPLISQLQYIAERAKVDELSEVLSTLDNQTCMIEHLVCTKPLPSSPAFPIIGIGLVHGNMLGGSTLLCVTPDFDILALPLVPTYLDTLPHLLIGDRKDDKESDILTSQPIVTKEPFDHHIRRILQRRTSNPVFKSNLTSEPTVQDCLQLLKRSTKILREEYIEKLDLSREKIQERVRILGDLKEQQVAEINALNKTKDAITAKAEQLAEKFEDVRDRQDCLLNRAENVLRGLLRQTPVLSDAEREMRKELILFQERLKHLQNGLLQVKAKRTFQSSQINRHQANQKCQRLSGSPTDTRLKQIQELLTEEGEIIANLVKRLHEAQKRFGL